MLNFWASWCPPCRQEMPALDHVARLLTHKVGFLGLDTQDGRSAGLSLAKSAGVSYPLAADNTQVWSAYGVYGLPTTFFIGSDGQLVGRQVGAMTESRLKALVGQVFGVSAGRGSGA